MKNTTPTKRPAHRPKLEQGQTRKNVFLLPSEWEELKAYGKTPGQAIRALLKSVKPAD